MMQDFENNFLNMMNNKKNPFHPLVWINGDPLFGKNVYIGGFSEVNAKGAKVIIGDNCDIASFVAINCQDSHKRCLGLSSTIDAGDITIENNVFIGSHSVIKMNTRIGHHSVIAAGTVLGNINLPPYSLAAGNPPVIKAGYYKKNCRIID